MLMQYMQIYANSLVAVKIIFTSGSHYKYRRIIKWAISKSGADIKQIWNSILILIIYCAKQTSSTITRCFAGGFFGFEFTTRISFYFYNSKDLSQKWVKLQTHKSAWSLFWNHFLLVLPKMAVDPNLVNKSSQSTFRGFKLSSYIIFFRFCWVHPQLKAIFCKFCDWIKSV